MKKLREFLNSKTLAEQQAFAANCKTTIGYLRKAISAKQKLGDGLCICIERESAGGVTCEDLRPDVDWGYLRNSKPKEAA